MSPAPSPSLQPPSPPPCWTPSPDGPPCQTPPPCGEDKEDKENRRHYRQGTSHCTCLEHCFLFGFVVQPKVQHDQSAELVELESISAVFSRSGVQTFHLQGEGRSHQPDSTRNLPNVPKFCHRNSSADVVASPRV